MKNLWKILSICALAWFGAACSDDDDASGAQPLATGEIEVYGSLLDIRPFKAGAELFPQHKDFVLPNGVDNLIESGLSYVTSVSDQRGPEALRVGSNGMVYLATPAEKPADWREMGASFVSNEVTFHVYSRFCWAGEQFEIPYDETLKTAPILLGKKFRLAHVPAAPGVVIAKMADDGFRERHITNVNIHILADGSYLALCTNGRYHRSTDIYRSTDRGASWSMWSDTAPEMNFTRLFEHNGALYIMGSRPTGGNLLISRSDDNGKTWTIPSDKEYDDAVAFGEKGVIMPGPCHQAPCAMIIYEGYIWRAMEVNSDPIRPYAIFAPVDSDLLDPASWERTNIDATTAGWDLTNGNHISQLIEGNMVIGPDGKLYNLLRADCSTSSSQACLAPITAATSGSFKYQIKISVDSNFITMAGGGKKFTVRYDEKSNLYWAITNPAHEKGANHAGYYPSGVPLSLVRNKMVLCYSSDLKHWIQYKTIVENDDPWFHGFQYVDWQFDGEDIIAVSRTAVPEERGLPVRQHDANMMTFHRIKNFRNL